MSRKLPIPLSDEALVRSLLARTRSQSCLGDLLLFGASGIEISPEELRALLRRRNIEEWFPVDIRPQTAARKAIHSFRSALEQGNLKVMVRTAFEDEVEVRYTLVGERASAQEKNVRYGHINQVIFDKITGELSFTDAPIPEIQRAYDHLCSVYTQREVMHMTRSILRGYGGLPLKAVGSLWFMPASARSVVDSLQALFTEDLNDVYGTAYFRTIGIEDGEDARLTLGLAIEEDLSAELDEAVRSLQAASKASTLRQGAINHAVQRVQAVKGRADLYRGLVHLDWPRIEQFLHSVTGTVTQSLAQNTRRNLRPDARSAEAVAYQLEDGAILV